jgi:hypothetical protein
VAIDDSVRIEVVKGDAISEIVSLLREYLELAENGELVAVALVGINRDGDRVHRDYHVASRVFTLAGGLSNILAAVNQDAGFPE